MPPTTSAEACPEDLPGAVYFETVQARQRHIRIEPMGDAVEFVAHEAPPWTGEHRARQVVTRGALPDTVTCGRGYIEVLAFLDDGIVVNEVRTFGDRMLAIATAMRERPRPDASSLQHSFDTRGRQTSPTLPASDHSEGAGTRVGSLPFG